MELQASCSDDHTEDLRPDLEEAAVLSLKRKRDPSESHSCTNEGETHTSTSEEIMLESEKNEVDKENCPIADSEICEDKSLDINDRLSYTHAASYWSRVPATVDGMLGGFGNISNTDIIGSNTFLKGLFSLADNAPGRARCVDCGAGIGRITQKLLQRHFGKIDLVEQCPSFAEKAKETLANNPKLGNIYCCGLQDFTPDALMYDVVWVQWVIIYLPDQDLIAFFKRMAQALKKNGVIVVKDNFTTGSPDDPNETIMDEEDSSVTRPLDHILKLASDAGLQLIRSTLQKKFPKQLFKVYMLAFRPIRYNEV